MAEPRAPRQLLFVYGSLKRGQRHHSELRGARFIGSARTLPAYRLLELGAYPALATGRRAIEGELFEIDREAFERLDAFEGEAYVRDAVRLDDGRSAQTYFAADVLATGVRELDAESWPPTSSSG